MVCRTCQPRHGAGTAARRVTGTRKNAACAHYNALPSSGCGVQPPHCRLTESPNFPPMVSAPQPSTNGDIFRTRLFEAVVLIRCWLIGRCVPAECLHGRMALTDRAEMPSVVWVRPRSAVGVLPFTPLSVFIFRRPGGPMCRAWRRRGRSLLLYSQVMLVSSTRCASRVTPTGRYRYCDKH